MKRYSFTANADVPIEFDHPGRFFTLLQCVSPIDVSLQQGGAQLEVLESITPGIWADFGEKPFTRIRILSHVSQKIVFLVSMVKSGFAAAPCSAEIQIVPLDNLAASASIATNDYFLGDDWPTCSVTAQFDRGFASTGGSLSIQSDDVSPMTKPRLCGKNASLGYVGLTSTNHHLIGLMPTGPYVRASLTNGATIQPVGARLILTVMRNVTA